MGNLLKKGESLPDLWRRTKAGIETERYINEEKDSNKIWQRRRTGSGRGTE
jgi:hypothetical protein